MGFSLVVVSEGSSLIAGHRLPTVMASLVAEHRFQGARASVAAVCGFSSCGAQT